MKIVICPCGKNIFTKRYIRTKYCSKVCFYKFRIRPKGLTYLIKKVNKSWFKKGINPWNAGTSKGWIDEGYKKIRILGKSYREHRFLIEQALGRKLSQKEIVHHIDGNKLNNNLNNLKVMSISDHISLHKRKLCE